MRRNSEEFKNELLSRCDKYRADRRKRRKRIVAVCVPLACVVAVAIPAIGILSDSFTSAFECGAAAPDSASVYAESGLYGTAQEIESADIIFYSDNGENSYEKHITDKESIEIISECFSSLENSDADIRPSDENSYEIEITFSDGTSVKYTHFSDDVFIGGDGNEYAMNGGKSKEFNNLIAEIKEEQQ